MNSRMALLEAETGGSDTVWQLQMNSKRSMRKSRLITSAFEENVPRLCKLAGFEIRSATAELRYDYPLFSR